MAEHHRRPLLLSLLLGIAVAAAAGGGATRAAAQAAGHRPQIALALQATGLVAPVHVANAGDGSGRLFIVEQGGRVRILKGGALLAAPFLDISPRVSCCGERGLLSLAFPPGFAASGRFYAYYTDLAGNLQISRFSLTADPDVAAAGSEVKILNIPHPTYANHNGGQLAFGPDGYLYLGPGDGGGGGNILGNAQNPQSLLGKMLRIDVETAGCVTNPPAVPRNYCVPATNPFAGDPAYLPEIWALGLRNPFRFSFDPASGDLYIADVGQNLFEEIDVEPAATGGRNYGWSVMEGLSCFNPLNFTAPLPGCNQVGLEPPVTQYGHSQGCAVTGGFVYRGAGNAGLTGFYLFSDLCSGRIWGLGNDGTNWSKTQLLYAPYRAGSFGEDEAGEIYLADYFNGSILKIAGAHHPVAGDFNGDGTTEVALLNSLGKVFVTAGGRAPVSIPGTLSRLAAGDFNADGNTDLAGINAANGSIWVSTSVAAAAPSWTRIPGTLNELITGDFNGDGKADLAGINAANDSIWFSTDATAAAPTWVRIPGSLAHLASGNFNAARAGDELAGRATDGALFVAFDMSTLTRVPGTLSTLASGNFSGVAGAADGLAGINAANGRIWFSADVAAASPVWTNIAGRLTELISLDIDGDGKSDLAGLDSRDGSIWYTVDLARWTRVPGRLTELLSGNFGPARAGAELAGVNGGTGTVWITTDLNAWTSAGRLP
jgi:glucose/arabinose dehydrogenase